MKKVPNKITDYIKDLNNKESFHVLTTCDGIYSKRSWEIY